MFSAKQIALPLILISAACGERTTEQPPLPSPNTNNTNNTNTNNPPDWTGKTTYSEHIAPLLAERCVVCHQLGGVGPFALDNFEAVKALASQIRDATASRRMPPWAAQVSDECRPQFRFHQDLSLSDQQIALIADWVEDGTVEGPPQNKLPDPPEFPALPSIDRTLSPDITQTIAAGGRDLFKCFSLDPQITAPTDLQGVEFQAGNPGVVHHAILYGDPRGESAARGVYDCFGGPGVSETEVVYAWAPGAQPLIYPEGIASQILPGSRLVLQIHYHPQAVPSEDRSTIKLSFATTPPRWRALITLIGNFDQPIGPNDGLMAGMNDRGRPEFRIPAGADNHVEELAFTLPPTIDGFPIPLLKVLGVGTHMHYVGTDMKFEIEHAAPKPGEPQRECMLHTPRWDFDWQRGYAYDVAVENAPEFRAGDRLMMRCIYNNSLSNPAVARALREEGLNEPHDVFLGEETLDEMCLSVMTLAYRL